MKLALAGLPYSQIMNDASALQAALHEESPGTGRTLVPSRQPHMSKPFTSRHVCFYKSGDAQFTGLPVVINNRTFKTFEALLDTLSKRIPLPFGVRTITTPRGHTAVHSLDQLHHGHSYICSDKRTVKPIDLEQARRRPPPWYNPRPVSNRRLRERQSPRPHNTRRNERTALLHTPKRLMVFRNGDPEVKHTLLLQKRTINSFEALLDYISEVMHFPVRRLHTPDGRRVDGLPALILCSGVLVAAGREPFRKENYDIQKPFAPTWLPAKRVGRLNHHVNRKKKSMTSSTKSQPLSPFSESYIVNQLHKSFAESAYDITGSVEMGTRHLLESVAETDTVTCMDGDTNEYIYMPKDDDIEKSCRVNQDGSMTVEMKVRLTIKEEETVHWTTTLRRQNVTSHMKSGLESHSDLGAAFADKIALDVDTDTSAIQKCPEEYRNVSTHECLQELYGEMMDGTTEKSTRIKEPLHPLPEQKQIAVKTESKDTVQKLDTSREESNSEQELSLVSAPVKCNKNPVPKPRSVDIPQLQAGMYKSAEVLQLQDNGQERVLHIYEQQSFLANAEFFTRGIHTRDAVFSASPAMLPMSTKDLKSEQRPAIMYSSLQKQETVLPLSKLQTSCERNKSPEIKKRKNSNIHTPLPEPFETLAPSMRRRKKKTKKIRVIVKKSHFVHIMTCENRGKDNNMYIVKKRKKIRAAMFNQAVVVKSMTQQYRTKSIRKLLKSKRTNRPKTVQTQFKSLDELSVKKRCINDKNSAKTDIYHVKQRERFTLPNKHLLNVSARKCSLTRQISMQEQHETQEQDTQELKDSTSFPGLHRSSSVLNEYVELWLQKSERELPSEQEQLSPAKPSQDLVITSETAGAKLASKKRLIPHIPLDKLSVKEPFHFPPKRCSTNESSSQSKTLKGETKSSQHNTSVNMPVPVTLSTRNNNWEKMSSEGNSSQSESSVCKTMDNSRSPENTQLTRFAVLDCRLATCEKVSSREATVEFPQSGKKDKNSDEPLVSALRCGNYHVKPTCLTREPSSEKTLFAQHSIEQIPKNNTLSKASLFSNQDMEKTELFKDAPFYKKSKSELSCENDKYSFLRPLSEKEVLPEEKSYTVKMAVRPDMSHVVDELCHSIHSLLEATQHKQQHSNTMPDFYSHLACTFGSSSGVFLAFLSIMTLRHGLENLNAVRQAENSLSCSEAFLMLQSLKERAAIEDAEQLRANLNSLKKSASDQLLKSWKAFQHLSDTCTGSCIISECTQAGSYSVSNSEEDAIQGLLEKLGVPDRVREELAAFHTQRTESVRCHQVETSKVLKTANIYTESSLSKDINMFPDCVFEDINSYVSCVIEKAVSAQINLETFASHSLPKETDIIHNGKQKTYVKHDINGNEMKDRGVCEQSAMTKGTIIFKDDCVEADCTMETDHIYSEEIGEMENRKDASEIDIGRITEVHPKLSESRSGKEDLCISEEKKSILEEDDEEHASVIEKQVSDKEENLQINAQAKWKNEGLAHTHLHSKTESVMTGQPTLLAVCVEHGIGQTKKLYSKEQQMGDEIPECYTVHQENTDDPNKYQCIREAAVCERKTAQAKKKNGSVANLISNLETCTQRPSTEPAKPMHRHVGHTDGSDTENFHNASSTGKLEYTTLHANSSSLAFSYDSQLPGAQESERSVQANRVKFIRDMFLARSQTRTQSGHRQLLCPKTDLSNSQTESSDSAGNCSRETSNGEDDASRLAIAKGFVRRTIERLYGGSNSSGTSAENIRAPSALKAKQKEGPGRTNVSSLASYHEARTRETDLSYFRATNRSDFLNMPAECVTQNEQMQCEDANSTDKGHWIFVENQIHESALTLQKAQINGKNHTVSVKPKQHSGQEEFFPKTQPFTKFKKCPGSSGSTSTYFNLPNANDSELEPGEKREAKAAHETQTHNTMNERNSFLLAFSPPVLKKADNKVYPLTEDTAPTVVNQPAKGQSVQTGVIKQSAEPDALEMLFVFCGQHCPIL